MGRAGSRRSSSFDDYRGLLQVTLDGIGVANLRLVRILPELLSGPPLPKEIPTAIELDLNPPQPLLICLKVLIVLAIVRFALPKLVLFGDEAFYSRRDALIAHGLMLVRATGPSSGIEHLISPGGSSSGLITSR